MKLFKHITTYHPSPNYPDSKMIVTIFIESTENVPDQNIWNGLMDTAGDAAERIDNPNNWE